MGLQDTSWVGETVRAQKLDVTVLFHGTSLPPSNFPVNSKFLLTTDGVIYENTGTFATPIWTARSSTTEPDTVVYPHSSSISDYSIPSTVEAHGALSLADLKAYYDFEEASGNFVNSSTTIGGTNSLGSAADIAITGTITYRTAGKLGTGPYAAEFNNANNAYGQLGTSLSQWNFLFNDGGAFTISMWIKQRATATTDQCILGSNQGAGGQYGIYLVLMNGTTGGKKKLHWINFHNGTTFVKEADDCVNDDTNWHHYAVSWSDSSGEVKFYVDGVLKVTHTGCTTSATDNMTYALHLGRYPALTTSDLNAHVDDLAIWNAVKSDDDIAGLYNGGTGAEPESALGVSVQANLKDDNTGTGYTTSVVVNPVVIMDMKANATDMYSAIAIYHDNANTTATQYQIQSSVNKSTWTTIRTINVSSLTDAAWNYIRFILQNEVRYIRVRGTDGTAKKIGMKEIKFLSPTIQRVTARSGHKNISTTDTTITLAG